MTQQAQKACPQCGALQDVNMAKCFRCNHVFRTQFGQLDQTQVFPVGALPYQRKIPIARIAAWVGVATLILVLAVVAVKVLLRPGIVGEWVLADGPSMATSRMKIRPDGTGEIFWNFDPGRPESGKARPFRWRTEGSLFFYEPVNAREGTAPTMSPFKLFDNNRYLTLNTGDRQETWRRSDD